MKNLRKLDIVIIGVLIIISILSLGVLKLPSKNGYHEKYIEIHVKNKLYKTVQIWDNNYKESIDIETDLGKNIVEISNGGVRILDSDCPDKICVYDGFKDKPGDILVCLPHKVVVEIKGKKSILQPDDMSY